MVVHLIAYIIERNHPAYVGINMVDAERRSALLPVDGIVPEIIRVIVPHKNGHDLHEGKAMLPHERGRCIDGNIFLSHVNGLQLDRYSNSTVDINEQRIHGIQSVEQTLKFLPQIDMSSDDGSSLKCALFRVESLRGGLGEGNRISFMASFATSLLSILDPYNNSDPSLG